MPLPQALGVHRAANGRSDALVWAPFAEKVELSILTPRKRRVALKRTAAGYHFATGIQVEPGGRYFVRLDGNVDYPDPASRSQPEGVHGPSEILDPGFRWDDRSWIGLPLHDYILYELHVGTFSERGTFAGAARRLTDLAELGITAVELMPVNQFPGHRNWGYDGVSLYAVQNSYGGPQGLKRFVNACHRAGLAVVLDVVYNHLGPEGNHLAKFGPYFTDRYHTPWGPAVNFDGPESDHVRRFFIENALYWIRDYHIDALRLDAVHAITDVSAKPFLQELAETVHGEADRLGRRVFLMPESDLNDPRLVRDRSAGGFGLDAQWSDDFHHAVHAVLTGERHGYYQDFGRIEDVAAAFTDGYVYTGRYSPYRRRKHGASVRDIPANRFVVCSQNHDQVGNRAAGDRLNETAGFEALKLSTAAVLLSPYLPLLFMGQEYGETAPFLYFVDHSDPKLLEAVRRGRKAEFAGFHWKSEPPDPGHADTFQRSKLNHNLKRSAKHAKIDAFTRELIAIRKTHPAFADPSKERLRVVPDEENGTLEVRRWTSDAEALILVNFRKNATTACPKVVGRWRLVLDSAETKWAGPGRTARRVWTAAKDAGISLAPHAVVVYKRDDPAA